MKKEVSEVEDIYDCNHDCSNCPFACGTSDDDDKDDEDEDEDDKN